MRLQKTIDYLLKHGCPAVRYQVYRDFLSVPTDDPMMKELTVQLLEQPNVIKHLSAQHDDGWFGHELHGNDGMDGHIYGLLNLGIERDSECIRKAVDALMNPEIASRHKNWFRGGDALDADGRSGNRSIIAGIAVLCYPESTPVIAEEIALSYEHLISALDYTSIDDFSVQTSKQRYYKPNVRFPGANHISLLDKTCSWRSKNNMEKAKAAVKHTYELMRDFDEYITFKKPKGYSSGFVGPFNYDWGILDEIDYDEFDGIVNDPYHFHFGFWLRQLGDIPDWVRLTSQPCEFLIDLIENDMLMDMLGEKALKSFRQIMGIEPYWKKKESVRCDVEFSVLKACLHVINNSL